MFDHAALSMFQPIGKRVVNSSIFKIIQLGLLTLALKPEGYNAELEFIRISFNSGPKWKLNERMKRKSRALEYLFVKNYVASFTIHDSQLAEEHP